MHDKRKPTFNGGLRKAKRKAAGNRGLLFVDFMRNK